MLAIDIGDGSTNGAPVTVLALGPSGTVTVSNVAASTGTVSYFTSWDATAAGTIAPSANQAFTAGSNSGLVYLQVPGGRASVQITGGLY